MIEVPATVAAPSPSIGDFFKFISGDVIDPVVRPILAFLSNELADLMQQLYTTLVKTELKVGTPFVGDPGAQPTENGTIVHPPGDSGSPFDYTADWTTRHVLWLALIISTAAIAIAGGKMLWHHARGYHESLRSVLSGLVALVIVNALVVTAVQVMLWVGDRYSTWIIDQTDTSHNNACIDAWKRMPSDAGIELSGSYLAFIFVATLLVISMLIQVVLFLFRSALLVVLAGTIILPAAAATTDSGRKWLNKYLSWLLAFVFMKPAAATLFAVALVLFNSSSAQSRAGSGCSDLSFSGQFGGLVLMGAGAVVLPALLRILTPGSVFLAGSAVSLGSSVYARSADLAHTAVVNRVRPGASAGGSGGGGLTSGPSGASRVLRGAAAGALGPVGIAAQSGAYIFAWLDARDEIRAELGGDGDQGPLGNSGGSG